MATKKKKIWLSATSIQDEDLAQIKAVLPKHYEIVCSHDFLTPDKFANFDLGKHLSLLEKCDLFLGIINPLFIQQPAGIENVFLKEIEAAIALNKPYWFLVHHAVTFTRTILYKFKYSAENKLISEDNKFFDNRTIEIFKYIIEKNPMQEGIQSSPPTIFFRLDELIFNIREWFSTKYFPEPQKLMVASTVYGFEDQLSNIVSELIERHHEPLNSFYGSIKVNPHLSNMDNCVNAVEDCNLFLGIVRPFYGTGVIGGKNITFEEIKRAIELKKPRWFLVHQDVVFAEKLFNELERNNDSTPKLADNKLVDQRAIDLYNFVIMDHEQNFALRNGNWAQEFYRQSEMLVYIEAQFSDENFIDGLLKS